MAANGLAVIATLALWWASTGAILYLDGRSRRTFPWSMLGATAMLAFALWLLAHTSGLTTPASAFAAFISGLVIWAWQLVSFYLGYLTGPRKTACPPECVGWPRFIEAVRTSLYHELAAILGAGIVFALTIGQPNRIGAWTYVILWWMHQSAKFNVFFGVPNLGEEMLPDHLRFLVSFMRRRPMNLFFPISVTVSTAVLVLLAQRAGANSATPFEMTGYAMLATLVALAIAEHWFLVAPIHANALWSWRGTGSTEALAGAAPAKAIQTRSREGDEIAALESWSPYPPALCDTRRLHSVLESISTGAYGEVDWVRGVVKTSGSWIRFEVAGQSAIMAPFSPQRRQEPLVVATGRSFDRARLQAAFDACAA
jgi:putative photosynthetic complex assembly protein 2